MKLTLHLMLAALVVLVAGSNALAGPVAFSENFESMALGQFVSTANLISRDNSANLQVVAETGNQYLAWVPTVDTHLLIAGSNTSTDYNFDLRWRMRTTNDPFNQTLQWTWVQNAAPSTAIFFQIGRTATGVGFGGKVDTTGLTDFAVAGVASQDDWVWIRLQKVGNAINVKGWTGTLANEPASFNETGTLTDYLSPFGGGLFSESGLRFKYQGGLKIDNVSNVPEPLTLGLLGLGALGLLHRRR